MNKTIELDLAAAQAGRVLAGALEAIDRQALSALAVPHEVN